ncbi:MAG: hypothetical protein ACYT04_70945 [Nostoc sp.]
MMGDHLTATLAFYDLTRSDRTFASQCLHLLINHAFERFRLKSPTGDRTQVNVNLYTGIIMGSREVRCLQRATPTQK